MPSTAHAPANAATVPGGCARASPTSRRADRRASRRASASGPHAVPAGRNGRGARPRGSRCPSIASPAQPASQGLHCQARLFTCMEMTEERAKLSRLEYLYNKLVTRNELSSPSSLPSVLPETPTTHLPHKKHTVKAFWQFTFIKSLYFLSSSSPVAWIIHISSD